MGKQLTLLTVLNLIHSNFKYLLQPHEVSPEYLKGKAAKNAATTEKSNKNTSKDVKKKMPAVTLSETTKVSYLVLIR